MTITITIRTEWTYREFWGIDWPDEPMVIVLADEEYEEWLTRQSDSTKARAEQLGINAGEAP